MDKLNRRRAIKLRLRRHLRVQKRQVEEFGQQAEQRLEDDFFKRLERLGAVRRFVGTWVLLIMLLIGGVVAQIRGLSAYYQELTPVPGGTYTEGILGAFTNASPLYATDLVDASVSKLLFASLLTYDQNNQLTGDLASSWAVDDAGTTYTVHLKPHLTWHDGAPLTSADVLFTYQVIQNPDARSPLFSTWQGITVAAPDPLTVTFKLPNPLAPFPTYLTNGIVPRHILLGVAMADMRSQAFNSTQPVGAGPFQWQAIELTGGTADTRSERIALRPFANYHGGRPKLSGFVVRTFRQPDQLVRSLQRQEVTAAVGLVTLPSQLQNDPTMHIYNMPLTAEAMAFFRTTQGVLADPVVRKALVQGADTTAVINSLDYPSLPVREPLLHGQLAYNAAYAQAPYDAVAAQAALNAAGWVVGANGIRSQNNVPLTFQLLAQTDSEYDRTAQLLAKQWRLLGADVKVVTENDATFQNRLANHSYDAVIYGISIGADPDVYAYWHSSQYDPRAPVRLNLSEYHSARADRSLEDGRTRLNPALRVIKYQPFLQAWQADAPALGLYQPRFLYVTHGPVFGLNEHAINADAERFTNVQNWEIRQTRQTPRS